MTVGRQERAGREGLAAFALVVVGVGARLAFQRAFPTIPFWDPLQVVHFGVLIRDQGFAAPGWYWRQLNPGLPMILGVLFRSGADPIALARTATAVVTGLLGLLPFLLWRGVVEFRWRLLAGAILALWPGQIFFAGVPAQDNWVLGPALALACLAVRRVRSADGHGHPLTAALLYAAAFAIRQEMILVLLPLALAAGLGSSAAGRRRRDAAKFTAAVAVCLLGLATQRRIATGRYGLTTEHGALGLYGTFMPGSSESGWVDARAYVAALEPGTPQGLYGSPSQLVRLTWEEFRRRPLFHVARIAVWLPRVTVNTDADNLMWSLGHERATLPDEREAALRLATALTPLLRFELALVQGLFVCALVLALRRRRLDILLLASAVALKLAIHVVLSPVGRLVMPAVAFELLALPLAAEALAHSPAAARWRTAVAAAAIALVLLLTTPPLTAWIIRRDVPELPGVRRFDLHAGADCAASCRLVEGTLVGLTPDGVSVQGIGAAVRIECMLPLTPEGSRLELSARFGGDELIARVTADGQDLRSADSASGSPIPLPTGARFVAISARPAHPNGRIAASVRFGVATVGRREE